MYWTVLRLTIYCLTKTNVPVTLLVAMACIPTLASEDENLLQEFQTLFDNKNGFKLSDVEKLVHDKTEQYNKQVQPKLNYSDPLEIQIGFILLALRDFDELKGIFSVVASFDLQWIDKRMAWNSSDYGGIKTFVAENGLFWTPYLNLNNAHEKFQKVGKDPQLPIRFSRTGHAFFQPGEVYTSTCSADVTFYPWDVHTCKLTFYAYALHPSEIQLTIAHERLSWELYEGHGEWDLIDTKMVSIYQNVGVEARFTIKRRPSFIIVNLVLPILLMSGLNTLVFLIPVECGERISYAMTVLLAIAVFLTIISDNLPNTARSVAVVCYFLVSLLVISILIMIGMILNVTLYFKSEKTRVPRWCASIVHCLRCKRFKPAYLEMHPEKNLSVENQNDLPTMINTYDVQGTTCDNVGNAQSAAILEQKSPNVSRVKTQHLLEESAPTKTGTGNKPNIGAPSGRKSTSVTSSSKPGCVNVTWKEVSSALDIVFFVVSWLGLSLCTVIYFGYVMRQ